MSDRTERCGGVKQETCWADCLECKKIRNQCLVTGEKIWEVLDNQAPRKLELAKKTKWQLIEMIIQLETDVEDLTTRLDDMQEEICIARNWVF